MTKLIFVFILFASLFSGAYSKSSGKAASFGVQLFIIYSKYLRNIRWGTIHLGIGFPLSWENLDSRFHGNDGIAVS
jgi:hypothetical protein